MLDWRYILYLLFLFVAAVFLVLFAFRAWRRRGTPGAAALAVLMAAGAVWAVAYTLSLGTADPSTRLFWGELKYLGIVAVPPAWLIFALQYTGREEWAPRRAAALLAIEPLVALVLVFTNEAHGLFWSSRGPSTTGPFPIIESVYGPWFWVHLSYSYLLLLLGTVFLVQALASSAYLYPGQKMALVAGASIPWIGNALNVSGLVPAGSPDPAPLAFALAGMVFAWTLFRYGPLDVVSVARDAVVEGMGDGVIVLDAQDRVVDLNPAAQHILGCTFSEAVGHPVARVLHSLTALLERHRRLEEAHGETTLGNGSAPRDYDVVISSLRTRNTARAGRLISLRDITERKRAEKELREANKRLNELAVLKADFTAIVAHELGGPLAAIRRLSDMLGTEEADREVHAYAVDTIRGELDTLDALLADVQTSAAVERDDFRVDLRPVPLGELLADVEAFARTLPGDHPVDFVLDSDSGTHEKVVADPERIGQVLRNLLSNAAKYSPEGVPIELLATRGKERVRLEVADHGPGIQPEEVARIFEKFGRGHDMKGRKIKGVGLGLYISRGIVRAHGGDITVDSAPGEGAVFGFELETERKEAR